MSLLSFCKLIMSLTREILEEIIDKKLSPLQSSLDFLSAQCDSLLKSFREQESKIKELSSENSLFKVPLTLQVVFLGKFSYLSRSHFREFFF